jgi:division protein CdvB (Snf7/Vps24/ESCRT-III family)
MKQMDRQRLQFQSDIAGATSVVNSQLSRLRMLDKKFAAMDKDFRYKIAQSIKSGNNSRAKSLANELSNIRRVRNTTQNVSLALEVVVIRFSTINEFAMVMETINPTIELIKEIQRDISTVVPSASGVISEVNSITSDVLVNSNLKLDINKIPTPIDADAISILNEVEDMLEDEAKVRLPEIPTSIQEIRENKVAEKTVLDEKRVMVEG